MSGTLNGVDGLFYEWLELKDDIPGYGNTPDVARGICKPPRKKSPPIAAAFQQIETNHLHALEKGPRPPTLSNYRWEKQLKMQRHNSGEKRLEKLAACILDEDWVNQVPICSGFTHTSEGKRAIDLARRRSDSECEFIELKYAGPKSQSTGGANHPLFAAMEILEYGLVYLMARKKSLIHEGPTQDYLRGVKKIDLVVLAPSEFYEGFEMAWLVNAVNIGLGELVKKEKLNIKASLRCDVLSGEFVSFYHALEDLMDKEAIFYEETGIKSKSNDVGVKASEYEEKFKNLFPSYKPLFE